jgi:hypothetical protein
MPSPPIYLIKIRSPGLNLRNRRVRHGLNILIRGRILANHFLAMITPLDKVHGLVRGALPLPTVSKDAVHGR